MTETYRKNNSFAGMNQRAPKRGNALLRLKTLWVNLRKAPPADYQSKIALQACEELFKSEPNLDASGFSLRDYIAEEIDHIEDHDLSRYLFYRYRYEVFPEQK